MKPVINQEVYCKRNGALGIVISEDELTVVIESSGVAKTVTQSTFQRWYTSVPQEQLQPKIEEDEKKEEPSIEKTVNPESDSGLSGEAGIGLILRNKFIELVKETSVGTLDITVDGAHRSDVIKYNGRNVFECTYANKRFNVLCHPSSLTSLNLKRAVQMFPKEWGWALRAKFVFTELAQWPLMKTIITDGLFYREVV